MLGKAIFNRLTTDAAVAALIGTRLYPKVVPAHVAVVYPLAVYVVEDESADTTYSGASGLVTARLTVACFGASASTRDALKSAVLDCLDNADGTWAGVVVQGVFFENETEGASRDATTGEQSLNFSTELEFTCCYER